MYSMYVCYSIYCVMHILPKTSLKTGSTLQIKLPYLTTRCGKKSQISTVEGFTQQSAQWWVWSVCTTMTTQSFTHHFSSGEAKAEQICAGLLRIALKSLSKRIWDRTLSKSGKTAPAKIMSSWSVCFHQLPQHNSSICWSISHSISQLIHELLFVKGQFN